MASGKFDKGVSEVRPGTYIDFIDVHDYEADESGEGVSVINTSGSGTKRTAPDYTIGFVGEDVVAETGSNTTQYITDLIAAKLTRYCGANLIQEAY